MAEIHEHDLSPLLNSFNEGICYLNAQGELLYYNAVAQTHWDKDALLINTLTSQSSVARALAGEHVLHDLVHLDEYHVLLVNVVPLYSGTNTVTSIVVISQDVSEHVLLEQQAQVALDVLISAVLDTHGLEDIDEALRRLAALIPQLEAADNGIALRVDDTAGRLIPIALFGSSQESPEEWHAELQAIQLGAEHLLQNPPPAYLHTIRLARPVMYQFGSPPMFSNPRKLSAAIYAPVFLDEHVVGILGAERHRLLGDTGIYFPQWGVQLLAALARLATMSFEKTSLLTSVERLQKEAAEARTLLNQKEEFLLLTAHEIKNPLTAIRGQAQVWRLRINRSVHVDTESTQEVHDLLKGLDSIEHQTRRIEHVVNTLLEVSRVDLDRLELDLQDVDLVQLVKRTLREYLLLAANHELRLLLNGQPVSFLEEEDTPIQSPIKVQADAQRLEQVLTNLLSNAVKYSLEGTLITVSLRVTDDQQAELAVEDQGIGIPLKDQAHLTERFYRAENAQQSNIRGLGLGLYLVKALVDKHDGSLSIQSEGVPRKGSKFTIKLPYQKP